MSSKTGCKCSRRRRAKPKKHVKFSLEPIQPIIFNASSVPPRQMGADSAARKLKKIKEILDERAGDVMSLWVPVTLSLILVTLKTLIRLSANDMDKEASRVQLAAEVSLVPKEGRDGIKLWQAILISVAGVVVAIISISFLMIFLLKHKCFMCLKVYICCAFTMLTWHTIGAWFYTASNALRFPMDWITLAMMTFNFMAIVLIAMGYGSSAPKSLVQFVHIVLSSTIAYTFNVILLKFHFLNASCLGLIVSAWDLFAVLCPRGPLNNMIKMASKEHRVNTFIQPLIYTTAVWNDTVGAAMTNRNADSLDDSSADENDDLVDEPRASAAAPKRGTRLGLGDFIFYGMLTAAAVAECGLLGGLACYLGLFFGFCVTLTGLWLLKRPLPALPLPVFSAIVMVSLTKGCGLAWSNTLANGQTVV